MRRRSLVPLLAAPVAALTLLAGCGSASTEASSSGDSSPSSSSSPSTSASATAATALTKSDFSPRLYAAIQKAGTSRFTLVTEVAGQRSTGTGEADFGGDQPASSVTQKLPDGSAVEVRLVDGVVYLKAAQFGPKWIKIDPKAESGLGALIGSLGANSDPSRILEAMRSAAQVKATGTAQVGGVETTRYHVVLPRKAFVEALGSDSRVASLLPPQIAYDMWVDGEDLVRKQVSEVTVAGKTSTSTLLYRDYGEPVSIAAPPAAQTTTSVPGLGG